MKPPEQCHDMSDLREAIDLLDAELVALLAARAAYIDRAARLKQGMGLPARISDRVEGVVAHVRATAAERGLDPDLVEGIWRQLIDWSIRREEAVLGKEGRE